MGKLRFTLDRTNGGGGHTEGVESLVELASNGFLASGSFDNTIKIWDLAQRNLKFTFDSSNGGHNDKILSLFALENGNLASCSSDQTVKVWQITKTEGKLKFTFDSRNGGHNSYVYRLVELENGYLASSGNGEVKVWDLVAGRLKFTFSDHSSYVYSLVALSNGYLATGSWDGTVKLYDITQGKLKYTIDSSNGGHTRIVLSLIGFENSLISSGDQTIKIWDVSFRS